jgi:hypothetical protein
MRNGCVFFEKFYIDEEEGILMKQSGFIFFCLVENFLQFFKVQSNFDPLITVYRMRFQSRSTSWFFGQFGLWYFYLSFPKTVTLYEMLPIVDPTNPKTSGF